MLIDCGVCIRDPHPMYNGEESLDNGYVDCLDNDISYTFLKKYINKKVYKDIF